MSAGLAGPGVLRVEVADRANRPLTALRLVGQLARPATQQGARALRFNETAPGLYDAAPGALAGAWDLRVQASDKEGREFHAERRLVAP
jgi:nitrogen fixation protein FixH